MRTYIASRDHRLMRRVNRWTPPKWVRWWMIGATRAGDGWLWYALAVVLLVMDGRESLKALAASGLAAGAGILLFRWLKKITGRRRPACFEPHCWITLLPPDQFSFPSGHTITAFAVVVPLIAFYPSLIIPLLFCAVSVAASRILLGMHFLSDVIAGSLIGASLGYAALAIVQRFTISV